LLVVIVLGTTDVVFAIDSIPTVFGITDDPFVVWSSNAMAVLGMRPLFFLLAGMVKLFSYLQYGLAMILGFVGLKMIVEEAFHDFHVFSELGDIYLSLGIIIGILVGSVILSIIMPRQNNHDQTHTTTETNEMDA
jgi:tellurite resistance protein TerC